MEGKHLSGSLSIFGFSQNSALGVVSGVDPLKIALQHF